MLEITESFVQKVITKRPSNSYKGKFGRVLTIGGNPNFGGAIIMSASAAVYGGAGLVTAATDPVNFTALHARLPESMVVDYHDKTYLGTLLTDMETIVIGPGLGTDATSLDILKFVLNQVKRNQTIIIDGSAITLIAKEQLALPKEANIIFTPHQMEWQRLSGVPIAAQTDDHNLAVLKTWWADNANITVILKSNQTKVYLPNGEIWLNTAGNPGMATGGSGDTLTGIIAAFSGQFDRKFDDCTPKSKAVLAAVYVHSALSDKLAKTQYVTLPQELIKLLPGYMHQLAES